MGLHQRHRRAFAVLAVVALILGSTTAISIAEAPGGDGVATPGPGDDAGSPAAFTPPYVAVVTKDEGRPLTLALVSTVDGTVVKEFDEAVLTAPIAVTAAPDGSSVFYVDVNGASATIFRIAVTGGVPEAVTKGRQPAVSPDGLRLAYTSGDDVVVRSLEGGEEVRAGAAQLPPPATGLRPVGTRPLAWLDDRTLAALLRGPGTDYFVAVYSVDASSVTPQRAVASPPAQVIAAGRHPGEVLVAQDMEGAAAQIAGVDTTSGAPATTIKALSSDRTVFDVSPGGRFALVSHADGLYLDPTGEGAAVRVAGSVLQASF